MLIFIIDDEENALEYLSRIVEKIRPEAEVRTYQSARSALSEAKENAPDVIFTDISMPGIDGITLAKKFKAIEPKSNIVFVTGYSEYSLEAFSLDASGYLLKPASEGQVEHALSNLRYPIEAENIKVTAQCFGNFELFCNGEPIRFKYNKSKEVLAYMIDRKGASCSNQEVIVNLWEDDEDHSSYYRSLLKDISDTLSQLGCADIYKKGWGGAGIIPDRLRCDYYDFLAGKPCGINAYKGEYMIQYSWAENTGAALYDSLDEENF